ncbi:MAG: response regulator, partial [Pseudomonadota bacterium]
MTDDALEVWVVDDDQSVRWVLEKALRTDGMNTRSFERAEPLLAAIEDGEPDVLVTDVKMPGMSGLQLLERLRRRFSELPIIVMTAHSDLDNAVAAYRGGAFEYLPKPFDIDEAVELVHKAARSDGELDPTESNGRHRAIPSLIGEAP